jgi:hypothetical protein
MTIPKIQIDDLVRDMNEEELTQHEQFLADLAAKEAQAKAKAQEKAAILDRLGITAEEASLLLS